MTPCRLVIDSTAAGSWNMAVDEFLLQSVRQQSVFRIYQWSRPTLSLGYFQKEADRQQHPASMACDCVRRQTGGGAIIHDQELTYSLIVPIHDRWSKSAEALYARIHTGLAQLYRDLGATCTLSQHEDDQAFLCFERRAVGDILLGEWKVTGSAQRRYRGAVLQHGSILLRQSAFAPELQGLFDAIGTSLPIAEFARDVIERVAQTLELAMDERPLDDREAELTTEIARRKFANPNWTNRR